MLSAYSSEKTAFLLILLKAEHLYQTLFLFRKQEFPVIQTRAKTLFR
jgi:hypothetical protein